MDTYLVRFNDGEEFALMAYSTSQVRNLAAELYPQSNITTVHRIDEWQDYD